MGDWMLCQVDVYLREELGEKVAAAMHVAHGVDAHPFWELRCAPTSR
jgi:hypothetical protein